MAVATAALILAAPDATGACTMERATYADRDGVARIEFTGTNDAATVTNAFRMALDNNVVLDGIVQWTEEIARPNGKLTYKCPEGDATGQELARCTVWEGVVYAVDGNGAVGLLPAEGMEAPQTLILPDLGYALRASSAYGVNGFSAVPWDVFSVRGCQ